MAKQLNISFKENDVELELYEFVKSQLSPGNFIKSLIHQALLEKNGVLTTPKPVQVLHQVQDEHTSEPEETNVDDGEYGMD